MISLIPNDNEPMKSLRDVRSQSHTSTDNLCDIAASVTGLSWYDNQKKFKTHKPKTLLYTGIKEKDGVWVEVEVALINSKDISEC